MGASRWMAWDRLLYLSPSFEARKGSLLRMRTEFVAPFMGSAHTHNLILRSARWARLEGCDPGGVPSRRRLSTA